MFSHKSFSPQWHERVSPSLPCKSFLVISILVRWRWPPATGKVGSRTGPTPKRAKLFTRWKFSRKQTAKKHSDFGQENLTSHMLQETKKCLDAGRGQSMDLLYVAPCQNIPSQVESSHILDHTCHLLFFPGVVLWPLSQLTQPSPALKPTALTCLPQPCDTHKRMLSQLLVWQTSY